MWISINLLEILSYLRGVGVSFSATAKLTMKGKIQSSREQANRASSNKYERQTACHANVVNSVYQVVSCEICCKKRVSNIAQQLDSNTE